MAQPGNTGLRRIVNAVVESRRPFETPPLAPGRAYHYRLRVDLPGGGPGRTLHRWVAVEAGKHVTVDFRGR